MITFLPGYQFQASLYLKWLTYDQSWRERNEKICIISGSPKRSWRVDLNEKIPITDNFYDAVICVGTFTYGHLKPIVLEEFVRITKRKGWICFTVNEGIYESHGFDKKIKELASKSSWKTIEFFKSDYLASKDVNAWLGLFQVV